MTNHTGRLYALAVGLVVFFLAWAVVAARPWATSGASDKRTQALAVREAQLRREAALVNQIVALRRRSVVSHAPAAQVRVVTLPPLTITRTS